MNNLREEKDDTRDLRMESFFVASKQIDTKKVCSPSNSSSVVNKKCVVSTYLWFCFKY